MTVSSNGEVKEGFAELVWKISAGALIPSFATIVFNLLHHIVEYAGRPMPPPPYSVYDIGVGCAFSLVGICVASKDHRKSNNFLIVFVFLLLLILASYLPVAFLEWSSLGLMMLTNIICFVALSWAIAGVD